MEIPQYDGEVLYGVGTKADVGTGMLWFERRDDGVYLFGSKRRLTESEISEFIFHDWKRLDFWKLRGVQPNANHINIFEATLAHYWLGSAFEVSVMLGEKGLRDFRIGGRAIYFLCLRPKVRFKSTEICIQNDDEITGVIQVAPMEVRNDGQIQTVSSLPESEDVEIAHDGSASVRFTVSLSDVVGEPVDNPSVLVSAATCVTARFTRASAEDAVLPLTVWEVASGIGLASILPMHVIYIGLSDRIEQRITRHEKIQRALAQFGDDHDVLVLVARFDEPTIRLAEPLPLTLEITRTHTRGISSRKRLELIEKALISYFNPRLNSLEKDTPITNKVVVLTQSLWEGHFQEDPGVLGRDGGHRWRDLHHRSASLRARRALRVANGVGSGAGEPQRPPKINPIEALRVE